MNLIIPCGVLVILMGCASSGERQIPRSSDTTHQGQLPPPSGGQQGPAAFKENMSMIGAELTNISLLDDYRYVLTLELRTVLPSGNSVSLAESGQIVVVYPEYVIGDHGGISLENERNQRLYALRQRKTGEPVMGRITLREDGTWHLIDTEFQ